MYRLGIWINVNVYLFVWINSKSSIKHLILLFRTSIAYLSSCVAMQEWFDCPIQLHPPGGLDSNEFNAMEDLFHIQVNDEIFSEDWLECFATEILDAKYEKTDVAEVLNELIHLNAHQKADLIQVLQENNKMFDGTLGVYPHKKVHIDIDLNAKPVHSRPYPVP